MARILSLLILDGIDLLSEQLTQLKGTVMATAAEASKKLDALGASLDKISGETTGLVQEVRSLKEAAQNAGSIPDDLMARIDALSQKAEAVDSLVDDVAPNPTPTPDQGQGTA